MIGTYMEKNGNLNGYLTVDGQMNVNMNVHVN